MCKVQVYFLYKNLTYSGVKDYFEALQEKSSQDQYGNILGQLICFYLRILELEYDEEEEGIIQWYQQHPLSPSQQQQLENLRTLINNGNNDEILLDTAFHKAVKELFCWMETRKLLDEMDCPVQRFLVVRCLRKGGDGFINVRDITPLIAKLEYCIRGTVFTELFKRTGQEEKLEEYLEELQIYVKDMVQSPFGFLLETMHLAATISGDSSTLPQVTWLGKNEYKSLAIHGKKVELDQLRDLGKKLMKDVKKKFNSEIKMGLQGIKDLNWKKFEPEDDLSNLKNGYNFAKSGLKDKDMCLIEEFIKNENTKSFFTKGLVNGKILWKKDNCLKWLKKCKELLEMVSVLVHLLSGQPARSTEMATLRWVNSVYEQRGVYWMNGTIILLGIYSKTRGMTSKNKLIPR